METVLAPSGSRRRGLRVIFLLGCIGLGYYVARIAPLPFVESWWQVGATKSNDSWHRRHRMADWMVATGALLGKRREEVIAQLGYPPATDYFSDWSLVYNLGAERGWLSIDSEWLVLRDNAAGIITDTRIVRD